MLFTIILEILKVIVHIMKRQECPICFQKIAMSNATTLSCGHSYHSDCIVSWFRQKKTTCPCCRDDGSAARECKKETWEEDPAVQAYLSANSPTKEEIVEAYYKRDLNMNVTTEDCFHSCVSGLRLDPGCYEEMIKDSFIKTHRRICNEHIMRSVEMSGEIMEFKSTIHFDKHLLDTLKSEEYQLKLKLYKMLAHRWHQNDHKGIYNALTVEELEWLGW